MLDARTCALAAGSRRLPPKNAGRGFLNTGKELTTLVIAKTPITAEEIERCRQLARQVSDSDANRSRSTQASVNPALLR
jgi:hypothetical protein